MPVHPNHFFCYISSLRKETPVIAYFYRGKLLMGILLVAVTDYILGALTLLLGVLLWKNFHLKTAGKVLAAAFFCAAASAFLGGAWHEWFEVSDSGLGLWIASMLALFAFSLAILIGSIQLVYRRAIKRWLIAGAIGKSACFLIWYCNFPSAFLSVFLDFSVSLAIIFCIAVFQVFRKVYCFYWIASGVLVSFIGGWLWLNKIDLNPWLRHGALFHIMQTASSYLLFRGFRAALEKRGTAR